MILGDAWGVSADRFAKSASSPELDLVYGLFERRARWNHDGAGFEYAFRAWTPVWSCSGALFRSYFARDFDASWRGRGPIECLDEL
jgi:hypothetical protein